MKFHTHRFRVAKTTSSVATTSAEHFLNTEGNAQACNRCRRLKKRCSKLPPQCELCLHGGHVCSLGQLAITPNVASNTLESTRSTGVVPASSAGQTDQGDVRLSSPRNAQSHAQNTATASTFDGTYLSYVHAYFRHVHRAYPFLDRQEILSDAKASAFLNVWANEDSIVSAADFSRMRILIKSRFLDWYSRLAVPH